MGDLWDRITCMCTFNVLCKAVASGDQCICGISMGWEYMDYMHVDIDVLCEAVASI